MGNMEIWNKLKTPPPDAMKSILGGRLRGKSDINPQWRYEAITEVFGTCGIGWKYTIDRLWTEAGSQEQVLCFALISFYHRLGSPEERDATWSDPIPGIGGSMLVEKEKEGLHSSDEGYKMAVTDALSVALKMVGVGADVYRGMMESKYGKPPLQEPQAKTSTASIPKSEEQLEEDPLAKSKRMIWARMSKITSDKIEWKKMAIEAGCPKSSKDWRKEDIDKLVKYLDEKEKKPEPTEELTPEKCYELAEVYKGMIANFNTQNDLVEFEEVNHDNLYKIKTLEPKAYLVIITAYDTKFTELKGKEEIENET